MKLTFALLLAPIAAFAFGGWAVVTVDDLPEYVVTGRAVEIPFSVRQHGVTLLSNLTPRVTMRAGGSESVASVRAGSQPGHYIATWTAPRADYWSIRIHSGFRDSENSLLPLRVVAAGAPAPRSMPDVERGQKLFFAKGCVTCHMRGDAGVDGMKIGPELTGKRYVPDYVATFLDDPDSSPLSKATSTSARMPKLDLKQREIASLVAFLNSEGQVAGVHRQWR
ncbi:MAG: hypothetical protein JWM95_2207 [Gemmatimonadetes bacterium]|nr:hypothetical protein [Gemmatimonadota bacterium]